MKKTPDAIDRDVGSRIRMRRLMGGVSQQQIADAIGVTVRQIQKYENGSNRVSLSRLQRIAGKLDVPMGFFFDQAPPNRAAEPEMMEAFIELRASNDRVQLMNAFEQIESPSLRRRIIDWVKALAGL